MKTILITIAGLLIFSCGGVDQTEDPLNLKDKLSGKWQAKAFDGELHEGMELREKRLDAAKRRLYRK